MVLNYTLEIIDEKEVVQMLYQNKPHKEKMIFAYERNEILREENHSKIQNCGIWAKRVQWLRIGIVIIILIISYMLKKALTVFGRTAAFAPRFIIPRSQYYFCSQNELMQQV